MYKWKINKFQKFIVYLSQNEFWSAFLKGLVGLAAIFSACITGYYGYQIYQLNNNSSSKNNIFKNTTFDSSRDTANVNSGND